MDRRTEFLQEEYFYLQRTVESFDARALTIKGWSVTISMVGIGAAYLQSKPVLLLLSASSALLFWIIESLWKTFQKAFTMRLEEIERFLEHTSEHEIQSPRISLAWKENMARVSFLRIFFWPHVCLPHVIIILAGCLLFGLQLLGFGLV